MTERERMIELVDSGLKAYGKSKEGVKVIDFLADYFLSNGVIVSPVKVGATVYTNVSWTYKTDIPHETFDVYEDGELYCKGIVFSLSDLRSKQTNFERIKAMSVEEMAEAIQNITNSDIDVVFCQNKKECDEKVDAFCLEDDIFDIDLPCKNCIIEWLESEDKNNVTK